MWFALISLHAPKSSLDSPFHSKVLTMWRSPFMNFPSCLPWLLRTCSALSLAPSSSHRGLLTSLGITRATLTPQDVCSSCFLPGKPFPQMPTGPSLTSLQSSLRHSSFDEAYPGPSKISPHPHHISTKYIHFVSSFPAWRGHFTYHYLRTSLTKTAGFCVCSSLCPLCPAQSLTLLNHQPRRDAWDKCLGPVHWEDPKGSGGEEGGRGDRDGEHM